MFHNLKGLSILTLCIMWNISANGIAAHYGGLSDDAMSLSDSVSQSFSPEVESALQGVQFIAQHIRDNDKDNEVQ